MRFPGAQGCLSVVPESASIANRVFASFLAGLEPSHSDSLPPTGPLDEALQRLADIMHDPDIGNREPSSPMSFSCVPPVVAYRRLEIYARAAPGHRGAFSPLDTNGRPKRRCVLCRLIHILFHPSQTFRFFFLIPDFRNAHRSSGSRWTGTGYHTPVRIGVRLPREWWD